MTVGNFLNDANTTSTNTPSPPNYASYGYYYYDDFSVTAVCNPQVTNKVIQCGAPVTFDPPVGFDLCSGTNVAVTVNGTITNGTCPRVLTRNWTLTDACGNTNNWSQTVTIVDTNPPIISCDTNNLVPNGDFESYTNCPDNLSETEYGAPWFTPTQGTSDYFNACAGPGGYASVPTNLRGFQNPLSGQGYAGGWVYSISGINPATCYREYIEVPLVSPLIAGRTYKVSFYASLADGSSHSVAQIGAHFSVGPVTDYSMTFLSVTPQIVNPSYNMLSSTSSWMLVQGTFTASGGENYMTIGSFLIDTNMTAASTGVVGQLAGAYYYYDNVSVVPLCGEQIMNKTVPCGAPWTFDPPTGFDACSGTNVTVTVTNTTTNTCGTFFTRTWTLADLCGNTTNWTQTVTVLDPTPLSINCACLSESAANLLYTNGCVGIVPDLLQFTNCFSTNCRPVSWGQSLMPGLHVGTGSHLLTVWGTDCLGNSNGCQLAFTVAGSPPTISCPKYLVLYTCGTGAVGYFTPTAFNNIGPVICSPPSGSFFPINQSTLVTCTATNACGTATCSFGVSVLRPPGRFSCLIATVIGIPTIPLGNAYFSFIPDSPDGGTGVDFDNLGSSGQDGARFDFGPAQKFTFSTSLDFNAPDGAGFQLSLPPDAGQTTGKPLLRFKKTASWQVKVDKDIVNDTSARFRSIGIGTNGDLFSSFTHDTTDLNTNVLLRLTPASGATSAMVTITLDCLTREIVLGIPHCDLTNDPSRHGWDGLIYGNPRPTKTNKTARVILTPTTPVITPPITTLDLLASNLSTVTFDNPSITTMGRKWGDGHVTLMKAYDDGEEAISFASGGPGGGVTTDFGNAATFRVHTGHFQNGDVPNEEQLFTIRGWPPGTTTNRPPPPPIFARVSASAGGAGVDCAADYTSFAISNVTLQFWNGTTLVTEKPNVPASLASSLVTLSDRPTIISSPGNGVLSLAHTNPFIVYSGLDCPSTGCFGTELRILPQSSPLSPPPVAFGEFTYSVTEGTDNILSELQTTPACTPVPLDVQRNSTGAIVISWAAAGFHLMGAENAAGPWYDLGVSSPVVLNGNHPARYFRLACD